MINPRSIASVTGFMLFALLMVVSCAPNGKRLRGLKVEGTNSKVLTACRDHLPANKLTTIDGTKTVRICVLKSAAPLASEGRRTKSTDLTAAEDKAARTALLPLGPGYEVEEMPVRFGISRQRQLIQRNESDSFRSAKAKREKDKKKKTNGRPTDSTEKLKMDLNIHLRIADETYAQSAAAIEQKINSICVPKIKGLWRRSSKSIFLNLQVSVNDEGYGDDEYHHELDMIPVFDESVEGERAKSHLALAIWPYHSDFYPDTSACQKKCVGKGYKCTRACVQELDEPFCQSLAKLSAHFVGIKDPAAEAGCMLPPDGQHPLEGKHSVVIGYKKKVVAAPDTPPSESLEPAKKRELRDDDDEDDGATAYALADAQMKGGDWLEEDVRFGLAGTGSETRAPVVEKNNGFWEQATIDINELAGVMCSEKSAGVSKRGSAPKIVSDDEVSEE